jgi:hypothetical protein
MCVTRRFCKNYRKLCDVFRLDYNLCHWTDLLPASTRGHLRLTESSLCSVSLKQMAFDFMPRPGFPFIIVFFKASEDCHGLFIDISFFFQCHRMSLMDFVVSPPGCGRSVTDLWGWDAHEVQLRCPDEVNGDIWIWSTRRGIRPKFY